MFERRQRHGGHGGDVARVASHRGLPDGRGSGDAADRCAVRLGPRPADHHPDLPDSPQGGRDRPGAGPPRRAAASGARQPGRHRRRATARRPWRCCSEGRRNDHQHQAHADVGGRRADTSADRESEHGQVRRRRGSPFPAPAGRRATGRPRGSTAVRCWTLASCATQVVAEGSASRHNRRRGTAAAAGLVGRPARRHLAGPVAGQRR